GVTTRFLHAHHLADLRQSIPGTINSSIFLKELRVGAPVLDENFVRALAEYDRKQLDAIEALVRSSLSYAQTFK
uniref:hypothetical protein n=1 Tax=Klebsiella pneumoniae TaxID=573 RepID=UPI003B980C24